MIVPLMDDNVALQAAAGILGAGPVGISLATACSDTGSKVIARQLPHGGQELPMCTSHSC